MDSWLFCAVVSPREQKHVWGSTVYSSLCALIQKSGFRCSHKLLNMHAKCFPMLTDYRHLLSWHAFKLLLHHPGDMLMLLKEEEDNLSSQHPPKCGRGLVVSHWPLQQVKEDWRGITYFCCATFLKWYSDSAGSLKDWRVIKTVWLWNSRKKKRVIK